MTNRSTVHEPARDVDVIADVDVIVCGGGPAGTGAALAAARNGASTLMIEGALCLGGMATSGMVNRLGPYHDQKEIMLRGIPWEVLRILIGRGLAQEPIICEPKNWKDYWLVFDPEGMKLVLDELTLAAGVQVLLAAQVVAPLMDGGRIKGVIVESKSGRQAVLGKVVVDATGDGDVAARAGAPFALGRAGDQLMQPFTTFFKCLNMDWPKAFEYVSRNYGDLVKQSKEEGGNDFVLAGTDSYLHAEETYFNCLHEHHQDGTQVRDISRAAMQLRRKMWKNVELLRRHVPGCERVSLSASAAAMGVRESRRITGDYELQLDDVLSGRQFDDQVYRYACFVDIHEPKPGDKSAAADRALEPGKSYGIPYRCLVPVGVEHLLVAGRCFSASHEALASARMMPSCLAMGEAAGTAAALSARDSISPRTLNVSLLRGHLAQQGVLL
jgi:glycine/D-amino acid oxidase-like deaminating enzyme